MKKFTSTREYELMPEDMHTTLHGILLNYTEGEHQLGILLGGSAFLIETDEDLKQIDTTAWVPGSKKTNILEHSCLADGAEELKEHYYIFFVNNNGGGPSYWIPKAIAEKYNTIMATIRSSL